MKHIKSERAQSLVEMAISIAILVYLLSGAVEFGILFFQYVQLRDAAQEGALYGAIDAGRTEVTIENHVMGASNKPINLAAFDRNNIIVEVFKWNDNTSRGTGDTALAAACESDGLKVTVKFHHVIFMPFIPFDDFDLSATTTDTVLLSSPGATGCPVY